MAIPANVYFQDANTLTVYDTTNKMDFGDVIPGSSSLKKLEVVNNTGVNVSDVVITKSGEGANVLLDLSIGNDPPATRLGYATDVIKNSGLPWMEIMLIGIPNQYIYQSTSPDGSFYVNGANCVTSHIAKIWRVQGGSLIAQADLAVGGSMTTKANFDNSEYIQGNAPIYTSSAKSSIYIPVRKVFSPVSPLPLGSLAQGSKAEFFAKLNVNSGAPTNTNGEVQLSVTATETA